MESKSLGVSARETKEIARIIELKAKETVRKAKAAKFRLRQAKLAFKLARKAAKQAKKAAKEARKKADKTGKEWQAALQTQAPPKRNGAPANGADHRASAEILSAMAERFGHNGESQ